MRRLLLKFALVCSVVALGCASGPTDTGKSWATGTTSSESNPAQTAVPEPSPGDGASNVLFLLLDDANPAMLEHMPTVQTDLVEKGTVFENATTVFPLCCPSRATIQRGQYSHNTRVISNSPSQDGGYQRFSGLDREQSTVATWLDGAGYETSFVGKYMNGFTAGTPSPPGWDSFEAVQDFGGEEATEEAAIARRALSPLAAPGTGREPPFFEMVGFTAPHLPNTFEEQDADKFEDVQVPRTPAWNEGDVSDKPRYIREDKDTLYNQQNPSVGASCRDDEDNSVEQNDCEWRNALRNLQTVDRFVGDALAALEASGELDNTFIFLYSDNGNHYGSHRLDQGKLAPYKEETNFPLIVRGPGVPQGVVSKKLVGNHDLAPTFAELAEAKIPGFVDGRSFVRLLDADLSNDEPWRSTLYVERAWRSDWRTPSKASASYVPPYEAIRTEKSLYVRYRDDPWTQRRDGGFEEYYDLATDPYQLRNLAHYDEVPERILRGMEGRLKALRDCSGDACSAAEDGRAQPRSTQTARETAAS